MSDSRLDGHHWTLPFSTIIMQKGALDLSLINQILHISLQSTILFPAFDAFSNLN
jgi:hypothetical protein